MTTQWRTDNKREAAHAAGMKAVTEILPAALRIAGLPDHASACEAAANCHDAAKAAWEAMEATPRASLISEAAWSAHMAATSAWWMRYSQADGFLRRTQDFASRVNGNA